MYNRVIKSVNIEGYQDWIKENEYSILSPKHRRFYAEMVFTNFCVDNGITFIKINPHFEIIKQIPSYFLKKIQQKELKKLGKINLDFFCFEGQKGYFVGLKMGTSDLNAKQKQLIREMQKNKVFLFRVYEDAEMFIKRLN
jgi:hypothetical protein